MSKEVGEPVDFPRRDFDWDKDVEDLKSALSSIGSVSTNDGVHPVVINSLNLAQGEIMRHYGWIRDLHQYLKARDTELQEIKGRLEKLEKTKHLPF